MPSTLSEVGTVKIGTESYQLVRTGDREAWTLQFIDEPPWQGDPPGLLSWPQRSWHRGGLASQGNELDRSEYGQNTDARFEGRLLAGPHRSTISVPGGVIGGQVYFFEALNFLWVCAGRLLYRIDPITSTAVLSLDAGIGFTVRMGIKGEGDTAFITIDDISSSTLLIRQLSAIVVGGPDTWITGTATALRLTVGFDRIFKISKSGELRNILSGLNLLTEANWADRVQCGATGPIQGTNNIKPNELVSYGRTVVVGKADGIFIVGPEGKGEPLTRSIPFDPTLGRGLETIEPYVYIPHNRGTQRFIPGLLESCGLEKMPLNESVVRGRFLKIVEDGKYKYGLIRPSDTYVLVGRELEEGDTVSPIVWDTLMHIPTTYLSYTLHISNLWNLPRLFIDDGGNSVVSFYQLTSSGGSPDPYDSGYLFAASSIRFTPRLTFDYDGVKDFPKVDLILNKADATHFVEVAFSVDRGAYSGLDINGVNMKATTNGITTFYLPRSAVGREIQYRLTLTNPSGGAPVSVEVAKFEPYAMPQSKKAPLVQATLHLAEQIHTDAGVDRRGVLDQLNDLVTLSESGTSIDILGPWGDFRGWLRKVQIIEVIQEGHSQPEFIISALLQRREEVNA